MRYGTSIGPSHPSLPPVEWAGHSPTRDFFPTAGHLTHQPAHHACTDGLHCRGPPRQRSVSFRVSLILNVDLFSLLSLFHPSHRSLKRVPYLTCVVALCLILAISFTVLVYAEKGLEYPNTAICIIASFCWQVGGYRLMAFMIVSSGVAALSHLTLWVVMRWRRNGGIIAFHYQPTNPTLTQGCTLQSGTAPHTVD